MKRLRSLPFPLLVSVAGFLLIIFLPAEAAAGARAGLSICGGVIIPSLFPFLAFSGLCTELQLPQRMAAVLGPWLRRLGISPYAAAPLLLGLTGGYPVGAAAVANLVRSGTVSPEEGARLLPFCNNTGPAFLVSAAGAAVFGSARLGIGLYLCHVAAALTLALLSRQVSTETVDTDFIATDVRGFSDVFPDCIRASAAAVINICAFVVFFSVLTALLRSVGIFSALSAAAAVHFGVGLQASGALLTGLLELGSGIGAMSGLPATPGNLALAAFLIGFGGLSVHCQTLSVLDGTNVKCARHFIGRILHGGLSAAYSFLLFTLLRI